MDNPNQQNTAVTGEVITNTQGPIAQSKSHKTLIISIIVIVAILICCAISTIVSLALLAANSKSDLGVTTTLNAPTAKVTLEADSEAEIKEPDFEAMPGGAVCDETLCSDVWYSAIVPSAQLYIDCKELELQDTTLDSKTAGYKTWVETWILNGCDKDFPFKVAYTTDPNGGTNYDVIKKF